MINISYTVTCDQCGKEIRRTLDIQYVTIIDRDNAKEIFKLCTPAIPNKWLTRSPKKAGDPDKIFCSNYCMNESIRIVSMDESYFKDFGSDHKPAA